MTSKPALLSSLVSTVLVVAGFLVLFERTDIGTSLIEQSSMYFHHEQAKKGVFGFIRKNSDVDSSMHLSDGLYIDTATAKASVKYIAALLTFAICLIAHFAYLTLSAIWPVSFKNIYHIYHGVPGSILELAYDCSLAQKDFWSIRDKIFWGQRTCIMTSEKSVSQVLSHGAMFERVKAPGDCITSPHSILGAGGVSKTWNRLRTTICRPFFNQGAFEDAHDKVVDHVIKSVEYIINQNPEGSVDLFHLVNRLVVESHLLTVLGVDSVAPGGKDIPVRDFIDTDKVSSGCMADIIDKSINVKMAEPKFSSIEFAPMMTWLTNRLTLPMEELGGIERILAEAQRKGELSSMERLHNIVMFMIALAPSPASFWTILHVYKDQELLGTIREECGDGVFKTLSMAIKETLRMYAPVPIMVTRYYRASTKSSNFDASNLKGTNKVQLQDGDRVLVPTIIMHNSPHLWINPNKYDPSRFDAPDNLQAVGKSAQALLLRGSGVQSRPQLFNQTKSVRKPKAKARYFPFGQGKHTCLGQPYASWLTFTVTATIFNHFDMEIEDVEGLLDKKCSFERIKDHVYTFPKAPFMAKIRSLAQDEEKDEGPSNHLVKELFRKSMAANMHKFSEFLQETEFDDDDDDDEDDDFMVGNLTSSGSEDFLPSGN